MGCGGVTSSPAGLGAAPSCGNQLRCRGGLPWQPHQRAPLVPLAPHTGIRFVTSSRPSSRCQQVSPGALPELCAGQGTKQGDRPLSMGPHLLMAPRPLWKSRLRGRVQPGGTGVAGDGPGGKAPLQDRELCSAPGLKAGPTGVTRGVWLLSPAQCCHWGQRAEPVPVPSHPARPAAAEGRCWVVGCLGAGSLGCTMGISEVT